MLSSFTRDEKKLLVGLTLLLGLGSSMNLFLGARANQTFVETAPQSAPKATAALPATTATSALAAPRRNAPASSASLAIASVQTSGKIDLNLATAEALQTLPGIGAKTADAIMSYRAQSGGFRTADELTNVKGIGPAKLQQILPYVEVAARPSNLVAQPVAAHAAPVRSVNPTSGVTPPPQARALSPAMAQQTPTGPININIANEEQLASLDHIGPVIARRIVEYRRQYGLFPSVDSLDRVKGIGPKILQANRHRLAVR